MRQPAKYCLYGHSIRLLTSYSKAVPSPDQSGRKPEQGNEGASLTEPEMRLAANSLRISDKRQVLPVDISRKLTPFCVGAAYWWGAAKIYPSEPFGASFPQVQIEGITYSDSKRRKGVATAATPLTFYFSSYLQ